MATRAANTRLAREYKGLQTAPVDYILAHPSENNILEWHYVLTGPPDTPYSQGQYWGTLVFPPDYPYKPPAIRMITPSGRFSPSARLCLSISDFHPKSFNPTWGIGTILIGLLSFMTGDEMTTGSVSATEEQRKEYARRSRWWNSCVGGIPSGIGGMGGQSGDGGARFRREWPDIDAENKEWMRLNGIDMASGRILIRGTPENIDEQPDNSDLHKRRISLAGAAVAAAAEAGGRVETVRMNGAGWMQRIQRHKWLCAAALVCVYVFAIRVLGDALGETA